MFVVAALYQFVALPDYRALRVPLLEFCEGLGLRGTLLLAEEGINGTVSGSRDAIDTLLAYLQTDARFAGLDVKESFFDEQPFYRMKVKLKREIVTLGVPGVHPSQAEGTHVPPAEWNALIDDPHVTVLDVRNHYEIEIGSFTGAVDPGTKSFRDFPAYVAGLNPAAHPKVAMFCTGGIRCEKAAAYMLSQGFREVYQLQGGILNYLAQVPAEQSRWRGECFVFDNRVAVNHELSASGLDQCHGCRRPISEADKASPLYQRGVSCSRCHDSLSEEQRAAFAERQRQVELAESRQQRHIGQRMPSMRSEASSEATAENFA
jgi:UPF0176 protein